MAAIITAIKRWLKEKLAQVPNALATPMPGWEEEQWNVI